MYSWCLYPVTIKEPGGNATQHAEIVRGFVIVWEGFITKDNVGFINHLVKIYARGQWAL